MVRFEEVVIVEAIVTVEEVMVVSPALRVVLKLVVEALVIDKEPVTVAAPDTVTLEPLTDILPEELSVPLIFVGVLVSEKLPVDKLL